MEDALPAEELGSEKNVYRKMKVAERRIGFYWQGQEVDEAGSKIITPRFRCACQQQWLKPW